MSTAPSIPLNPDEKSIEEVESVTIRFAGDSGDGMQITGTQFTDASAAFGNDLATLPDFPAEIRAPAGTVAGVSAFQIHIAAHDIRTPGDDLNVLVAMNAAALKANLADLEEGGILVVDEAGFNEKDLEKAELKSNPLENGSLDGYRVIRANLTELTLNAVKEVGLTGKQAELCKNFFTLGLMFWLYDRPLEHTLTWIEDKYGVKTKYKAKPEIANGNKAALLAGYNYAETIELFHTHYRVRKADLPKGKYRKIAGNEALAFGLIAASQLSKRTIMYGSYPITPASDILHHLSKHKGFGVVTFQAEDEIAAIASSLGAAYAGGLGVTATSGPGMLLKAETMNLAVMTELPLVIIDVQRGGPSTGLPTKTEQSDLLMAIYGRSGDSPMPVLSARSPSDCFAMGIEAVRIALKYMTPVILLTDGYLANGSEPWLIPDISSLPTLDFPNVKPGDDYKPYRRDPVTLARPWAIPGVPGFEHRIGGLEKAQESGMVSYDSDNHQAMTFERQAKIAGIAKDIPLQEVSGAHDAKTLIVSWGGTFGAVATAVEQCNQTLGMKLAHAHINYLNPFPSNLGEILKRYSKIIVPELNMGQLRQLLSGTFGLPIQGINQIKGKPFKISYLVQQFKALQ